MATVCRTIAVNAAFLQEIKEDNRQLKEMSSKCEDLACRGCASRSDLRVLSDTLDELRDQLALHFALEDAYGYFEDAVLQAPRLCQRAEALRGEHVDLFRSICQLADRADELMHERPSTRSVHQLCNGLREFIHRFAVHERQEDELIMAAFEDDIGVGD